MIYVVYYCYNIIVYHSFKILLRFWLAYWHCILRLILHNHAASVDQIMKTLAIFVKMTSIVQAVAIMSLKRDTATEKPWTWGFFSSIVFAEILQKQYSNLKIFGGLLALYSKPTLYIWVARKVLDIVFAIFWTFLFWIFRSGGGVQFSLLSQWPG